jgi:hypothetical protein
MCTLPSEVTTGGGERTIIEHLVGRIDHALPIKALISCSLHRKHLSAFVLDICPVRFPTAPLELDVSKVEAFNSA